MTESSSAVVQAQDEQQRKSAAKDQPQRAPSTIRTVEDMAQVMVDTWGHRSEFVHGMIVNKAQIAEAGYDWEHGLRIGAIRLLTEAEARPESHPTTFSALHDGSPDEGLARATRFHSGILDELPETVTTEGGPAEPKEYAKPTIEYSGPNSEAPRPIRTVGSAQEAEAAGMQPARVVATPEGPAFESAEEREAGNEQRVSRRGRARE